MQTVMDSLSEALLELYIGDAIDWPPVESLIRNICEKEGLSEEEVNLTVGAFKVMTDVTKVFTKENN